MNAEAEEVIFTGSATEANNFVLKGIAWANKDKGRRIVVSKVEHDCVLGAARWLEGQGFEVTYLPVDRYGLVDVGELEKAIRKDTILVSIMHANNEIGTIEPIEEIAKVCSSHGVMFHSDAAQTFGKIPVDVRKLGVDLLTVSAHKMYGPKGVAAVYIRKGVKIEPLLHGGGHEFGLRSSTVNVAGIVGFAEAARIAKREMSKDYRRISALSKRLVKGVLKIEKTRLNGHPTKRLMNISNFSFAFIEGESLVTELDFRGVAASTGSACSSESLEPSHVLLAIGLKPHEAHGSLRLSLGKWSKKQEVEYVLKVLPEVVERLRKISPYKGRW
jgi:cysteine desulfurase